MTTSSGATVVGIICRRELVHFVRQPARVGAALGTPLLLWLFLGSGFAESLEPNHVGDGPYAAFLLPGMMTLVAVFTAVFSSISIIDERRDGWLQAVLVSPAPRWSIAAGKTLGGGLVAFLQAAVLLPAAIPLGVRFGAMEAGLALAALAMTCLAMTALGVALAWRTETTAGYHAVMNIVFMPLWLLSGAFFPASGAASWLATIMAINPLTWCTQAIRAPLSGGLWLGAFLASTVFAAAALFAATWVVGRPSKRLG